MQHRTRTSCGACKLSLTKTPTDSNNNNHNNLEPILQDLSNSHLNELWLTAARTGAQDICRQIEEVRFERLERERERWYEQHLD